MLETISAVVAVLTFVYMVVWGKESLGDALERRRRRIEKARQVGGDVQAAAQVFLSYSRKDIGFVERLVWDLKAAGLGVWYDLSGLRVGSRWGTEIQRAITESRYVVVALSPHSVNSEWVEREFLYATQRRLKIVPVLVAECELPIWAIDIQYVDMRGAHYTENIGQLLAALDALPAPDAEQALRTALGPAHLEPTGKLLAQPVASLRQRPRRGHVRSPSSIWAGWDVRNRWRLCSALAGAAIGFALWSIILSRSSWIAGREQELANSTPQSQIGLFSLGNPATWFQTADSPVVSSTVTATPEMPRLDFESIDPLFGIAASKIESRAPTYQTDFDNWGGIATLQAFTAVEDGTLVVTSQGPGAVQDVRRMKTSDYAVNFDFRVRQGRGACEFMTSNGQFNSSGWRGFELLLNDVNGRIELGRNVWPGDFELLFTTATGIDFRQYHTASVIVLKNQVAVLVNDALLIAETDPDGAASYTHQSLGANLGSVCEFDNFKFWDLRDVVQ